MECLVNRQHQDLCALQRDAGHNALTSTMKVDRGRAFNPAEQTMPLICQQGWSGGSEAAVFDSLWHPVYLVNV